MATSSVQTCYRHGDRRAGVVCQRCDRPICPDCMRQASVGFHCPECTRSAQRASRAVAARVQHQQRPYVTIALVAVNVAVFLVDLLWTTEIPSRSGQFTIGVPSWEGALYGPNVAIGDWWRPLTVGFVHGNLMHVGFNMFLAFLLGQMLEPLLGRFRFLALYALSLLGGSVLILLMTPDQRTVGASGAVFGLMGAAFVGMRSRGIDPFSTIIGPLLVLNLITTFVIPNVSIGGHIGGLLAGAAGGWLLFERADRWPQGRQVTTALCALAAVGLFLLCLELPQPGPVLPPAVG